MGSRKTVRPTPPPSGPALVRPAIGVLVIALGGAADMGCRKTDPPMAHPGDPPMAQPMPPPPMPPPPMPPPMPPMSEPPVAPMPEPPMPEPDPPMVAPMPSPPPMANPGSGKRS